MALSEERKKQLEYAKQKAQQSAAAKEDAKAAVAFTGQANSLTSANKTGSTNRSTSTGKTASTSGNSTSKSALAWNPVPKSSSGSTKSSTKTNTKSVMQSSDTGKSGTQSKLAWQTNPAAGSTSTPFKNPFVTANPFEINRFGTSVKAKTTGKSAAVKNGNILTPEPVRNPFRQNLYNEFVQRETDKNAAKNKQNNKYDNITDSLYLRPTAGEEFQRRLYNRQQLNGVKNIADFTPDAFEGKEDKNAVITGTDNRFTPASPYPANILTDSARNFINKGMSAAAEYMYRNNMTDMQSPYLAERDINGKTFHAVVGTDSDGNRAEIIRGSQQYRQYLVNFMTQSQRATYYYLYGRYGQEKADEYIKDNYDALDAAAVIGLKQKQYSEHAKEHPILANTLTLPVAGAAKTIEGVGLTAKALSGQKPDIKDFTATMMTQAIKSQTEESIKSNLGKYGTFGKLGGAVGSFLYQTYAMYAENAAAIPIQAATGGSIMPAMFAAGGAADAYMKQIENGTFGRAGNTISAVVAGGAQGLAFKGIENVAGAAVGRLLPGRTALGKFVQSEAAKILSGAGVNGTQVAVGELTDLVVNGEYSNYAIAYAKNRHNGMGAEDARKAAAKSELIDPVVNGAVMGGILAGVMGIPSSVHEVADFSSLGRSARTQTGESGIISEGLAYGKDTTAYKNAERLAAKLSGSKNTTDAELGIQTMLNAIEKYRSDVFAQRLSEMTGTTVTQGRLSDPYANAEISGNEIRISDTADEPVTELVKHEAAGHRVQDLAPEQYADYEESLKSQNKASGRSGQRNESFDNAVAKVKGDYRTANREISAPHAQNEVSADFTRNLIKTTKDLDRIQRMADGSTTLTDKLYNRARDFHAKVKDIGGSKFVDEVTGTEYTYGERRNSQKLHETAMAEAVRNRSSEGLSDTRYDIVTLDNGKEYVEATRNVITGNSVSDWRKSITAYFKQILKNGDINIKATDGSVLTITAKDTAEKARDNYKLEKGTRVKMEDEEFLVKLHAVEHIDELAEISRLKGSQRDKKNHVFAKDGFDYRDVYFKDYDGSYYKITLSVGKSDGVSTIYNVGKIKQVQNRPGNIVSLRGGQSPMVTVPIDTTITQSAEKSNPFSKKNTRNSLRRSLPTEEQTYSEQFKEWFGDWETQPDTASKVVNEDGKPKIVYHGTSSGGFTEFDTYGSISKYGLFGNGAYFTESRSIAEEYTHKGKGSDPRIYEAYLNIKNPIDMDAPADVDIWNKALEAADYYERAEPGDTNEQVFRKIEEELTDSFIPDYEGEESVRYLLEAMGYDGITHIGGGRVNRDSEKHRVWIAFEPEQIEFADTADRTVSDNTAPTSVGASRYSVIEDLSTGENQKRFAENVDGVFTGTIQNDKPITLGNTPQLLMDYGANDLPLTIKQSTMYKIAYPTGYFGAEKGGHNLGIPALKQLPKQIADPIAILKSNSQDNSLVLLTEWNDANDNPVIIPLHLDKTGTIGLTNDIASAYGKKNITSLLIDNKGNSTVLYTKNNENIDQLLSNRLQLPEAITDDPLVTDSISQSTENVNPFLKNNPQNNTRNSLRRNLPTEVRSENIPNPFITDNTDNALPFDTEQQPQPNEAVAELMSRYGASRPSELAEDTPTRRQTQKNIFKNKSGANSLWDRIYTATVDDMHPFFKYNQAAEKTTGEKNYGKVNPYKLAMNSKEAGGRAAYIISDRMIDYDNNFVGDGLTKVLEDSKITGETWDDFNKYLVARHAVEWLDPNAHGAYKAVYEKPGLNDMTVAQSIAKDFETQHPEFAQAAQNLYNWYDKFLRTWLVDTGAITQEQLTSLREMYPNYVPFAREGSGAKSRKQSAKDGNPFMKAVGTTERLIQEPIENIMYNVGAYVNYATRNSVKQSAMRLYDSFSGSADNPLAGFWREVKPRETVSNTKSFEYVDSGTAVVADAVAEGSSSIAQTLHDMMNIQNGNVVTVMEDGKPRYFEVQDQEFLNAIENLSPTKMDGLLGIVAAASRARAALLTSFNPKFALVTNPIRDFGTYIKNTDDVNKARAALAWLQSYKDIFKSTYNNIRGKDNTGTVYEQYKAGGGEGSNIYDAGSDRIKKAVSQFSLTPKNAAKTVFGKIGSTYSGIADAIEAAPRTAEFKRTLDEGYDYHEALFRSKDVTTNFSRGGKIVKQLNAVSNFFNASIQGVDKYFRQAKSNPAAFATGTAALMIPAAIGWAWNAIAPKVFGEDDDKYKEAYENLSNYTKNYFYNWYIGDGKFFSLYKPRESAADISLAEAVMDKTLRGEDDRFKGFFADYLLNQFLPDGNVFALSTLSDLKANTDYRGAAIVPSELQDLPNELQYDDSTSYIAASVGKLESAMKQSDNDTIRMIGNLFNISPKKLDYIINSETGIIGLTNNAWLTPDSKNNSTLRKATWSLSDSFIKDSRYSTDQVSFFYENKETAEKQNNGYPSVDNQYLSDRYSQSATVMSVINALYKSEADEKKASDIRLEYTNFAKANKDNPAGYSDEVYAELKKLYQTDSSITALPTVSNTLTGKVNGKNESYAFDSVDAIKNYQSDLNKSVDEAYRKLFNDISYNAMSDEDKISALKSAKSAAAKEVKEFYLENKGKKSMFEDGSASTAIAKPDTSAVKQYAEEKAQISSYVSSVVNNLKESDPAHAGSYTESKLSVTTIDSAKIDGTSYSLSAELQDKVTKAASEEYNSKIKALENNELSLEEACGYTSTGKTKSAVQTDGTKVSLSGKLYNSDGSPRFDALVTAKIYTQIKENAKASAIEKYADEIKGDTPSSAPEAESEPTPVTVGNAAGSRSTGSVSPRSTPKSSGRSGGSSRSGSVSRSSGSTSGSAAAAVSSPVSRQAAQSIQPLSIATTGGTSRFIGSQSGSANPFLRSASNYSPSARNPFISRFKGSEKFRNPFMRA